ncbi:MAG TPA: PAS domain-containing protein [Chitinophagaceae bacterium]|nr:PAS domain-containing protein [Chitinophagaceae bacterium]
MDLSGKKISDTTIGGANVSITDILKTITDGFVALDRNFIVRMWNEAAEEHLGIARSFVLGKNILTDFFHLPELHNSALHQHLQRALRENITISTEQYIKFRDKWFDARIHPYKDGLFIYFKDVTTRKKQEILLEKLLKKEIDKHKTVARAVMEAQEKERAEIGKELHDNVNQILSTAKLFLEVAKNDTKERLSLIKRSAQSIHDAINEIRAISKSLVPPSISDIGLTESINDLVQNINVSRALKVDFFIEGDIENSINGKQKLMLFRIIQEQVNNVLKHAHATLVSIFLLVSDNTVELEITDDGKGFDMEKAHIKKGVGLSNIISRAELFHGKVDIYTAPGEGCKLKVEIPIMNLL